MLIYCHPEKNQPAQAKTPFYLGFNINGLVSDLAVGTVSS